MELDLDFGSALILSVTLVAIAWATYFVCCKNLDDPEEEDPVEEVKGGAQSGKKKDKTGKDGKKLAKYKEEPKVERKFEHPWLLSRLKGHTGTIVDIALSPNDKFLASCADDRIAHIWVVKDLTDKDHKRLRVNFPFDYATMIRWSPDSKAFAITRCTDKIVEIYKLGKKEDNSVGNITSALSWTQEYGGKSEYVGLDIACNGKFVMWYTKDGQVILRDVRGTPLKKIRSVIQNPIKAKVSPCGRYVVLAGSENMEIWQVTIDGTVKEITLKLPFSGFGASALAQRTTLGRGKLSTILPTLVDFDMNADCSKLVTIASDGSFAILDASAGNKMFTEHEGKLKLTDEDGHPPVVTLTSDARVLYIGANCGVYAYSTFSGALLHEIPIYSSQISRIICSSDHKYLVTAGDSVVYVFRNLSWYQDTIRHLTAQLTDDKITGALRTRMQTELASLHEEISQF